MFPPTPRMPAVRGNSPTPAQALSQVSFTARIHLVLILISMKKSMSRPGMVWLVRWVMVVNVCCALQKIAAADGHWVGTWGCGPQLTEPGNLPPAPLANSTLRQFVHVTIGGKHLRVRFS